MTQPAAKTTYEALAESLQAIILRRPAAVPSEFEMARLDREIGKLKRVDYVEGLQLEGLMLLARGDESAAIAHFERVLPSNRSATVLSAYCWVLQEVGAAAELASLVTRYGSVVRNDPDLLRQFKDSCGMCGLLRTARSFDDDMARLGMQRPREDSAFLEILDHYGLEEIEIAAVVTFAERFLRKAGIPCDYAQTESLRLPGAEPAMFYQFVVSLPPAELIELEEKMFAALAQQEFEVEQSGKLVLALTPERASNADNV